MDHKGTERIETDRLILEKLNLNHSQDLFELITDKDVLDFLAGIPEYENVETAVNYITWLNNNKYKETNYYDWAVVLKENNKLIGRIGLFKQDDDRMMADMVWYLNKEYRGKGYIPEAVKPIIKFLQDVGYKRIEAFANVKNKASLRVMEKCGFEFEGTLRKYDLTRTGDLYDANMFSIVTD